VSIEATKWATALRRLGFSVVTVAGEGPVDHLVDGLSMGSAGSPDRRRLARALEAADLVVVENLGSLPVNPAATETVAALLAGRRAIYRHHDLAWQRPNLGRQDPPTDDSSWVHVTISCLNADQLRQRGIDAHVVYNSFDIDLQRGDRDEARRLLGVSSSECLVLQPTRAIPRKNVPGGLCLAESLGATYWLMGPAEDGYGAQLDVVLGRARTRVLRGRGPKGRPLSMNDAYAAADVVVLPSSWEGFGNPSVESAVHMRPLAIGDYPVARELAAFGFSWFPASDPSSVACWLERPDPSLLSRNLEVARRHFDLRDLPTRVAGLMGQAGWKW
jgi:mannosylglucosylglycerate synthase